MRTSARAERREVISFARSRTLPLPPRIQTIKRCPPQQDKVTMLTIEVEKQERNTTVGFLRGKSVTSWFEGLEGKRNVRPIDTGILRKQQRIKD